ncbi:hypothetical protein ACFQI3_09665 [Hansschlegelia quercus]|uniref:hypothetical protein n=1 Tax=Hansschlegelia quercus TaxID=2528245 RepID=UPI00197AB492|nr:hypothetical protein [Hansschlegelia quercus]
MILLLAFLPLILALGASAIADAAGCRLDEASSYPCIIGGVDFGDMLAVMFVLGWLSLVSLPFGAAAVLAWLIVLAVDVVWQRVRQRRQT